MRRMRPMRIQKSKADAAGGARSWCEQKEHPRAVQCRIFLWSACRSATQRLASPPMPEISKDQVADTLEDIAMMLELKGENPFKIRAYRNAARAIETFTGNLRKAAEAENFSDIEGIGDAIAEKIGQLVTTGSLEYHTTLKAEFP